MFLLRPTLLVTLLTLATLPNANADNELTPASSQQEEREEEARLLEENLNETKSGRRRALEQLRQLEEKLYLEDKGDFEIEIATIAQLLENLPYQLENLNFKSKLEALVRKTQRDIVALERILN